MNIQQLFKQREQLRKEKRYVEADQVRGEIEKKGYTIIDGINDSQLVKKDYILPMKNPLTTKTLGKVALFGSGELSSIGRKVHERLIKNFPPPVKIALLPTPAGFEENPYAWYKKVQTALMIGLQTYKPLVFYIEALKNEGRKSTNNPQLLQKLRNVDYIHTGAGSPSYAVKHFKNSLAYQILCEQVKKGVSLSFASAAAIALSKFALPIYEIYKAGQEIHWQDGLDFFSLWGLNVTVIPHWDNKEGGVEIDTSFCYLGKKRFLKLKKLLPAKTNILCIAEQTACLFDLEKREVEIMGSGGVYLIGQKSEETFWPGQKFSFKDLI